MKTAQSAKFVNGGGIEHPCLVIVTNPNGEVKFLT